jgi:2-hydroxychromene-2-carboxylate isomerase
MNALESSDPLIVYVDIKSPYAFVAIRPILELEASLGMRFDWRPLTLDIPSYLGSAKKVQGQVVESDRSEMQWRMIKYGYKDARRYAERQGHILKGTEKIWDSRLANTGILWVVQNNRDLLKNYFEAVYPPFWRRELDIEDVQVMENCLETAGVESAGFNDFCQNEGLKIHDDLQAQLHPVGIFGVPTYVVNEKILFGREHLPLVGWLLGGSKGPAPDIAYEISDSV